MHRHRQSPQKASANTPAKKINHRNAINVVSGRKVSVGSQLRMKDAGLADLNSTDKLGKRYNLEIISPMAKITVNGASKIISQRGTNTAGNMNDVLNRLKQHYNESSQANFDDEYGDYLAAKNNIKTPHRNDTLPLFMSPMFSHKNESLDGLGNNELKETIRHVMLSCRDSELLVGDDSRIHEQSYRAHIYDGVARSPSPSSRLSLQLNTEINVDNIQVRAGQESGLRKAATNAQMISLGLRQGEKTERQQQSQFIDNTNKQSSPSYNKNLSPVIITSLDRGAQQYKTRKSIVFDVKSSSPHSERQGTPILGTIEKVASLEDIEGQYTEMGHSVTHEDVDEQQQCVHGISSPIDEQGQRILVPVIAVSDYQEARETKGTSNPSILKEQMKSMAQKGANTVHLNLFYQKSTSTAGKTGNSTVGDAGINTALLNPSSTAGNPFKQNATQFRLMDTLDLVAAQQEEETVENCPAIQANQDTFTGKMVKTQSVDANAIVDDTTACCFREAIAKHQDSSKKKWKNMTPYERSKVMGTFLKLQRELEKKSNVYAGMNPQRIQQDLSFCLSVGEIKPSPNPFIQTAEKKLGPLKNEDQPNRELMWDDQTLRDPNKIIASVLSAQSKEAQKTSKYCPENIPDDFLVPSPDVYIPDQEQTICNSTIQSQILNELEQFERQKAVILRGNIQRFVGSEGEVSLQLSPSQSILHQRYQLGTDHESMGSTSQDQLLIKPLILEIALQRNTLKDRTKQMMQSSSNVSLCNQLEPRMGLVKSSINQQAGNSRSPNRKRVQKIDTLQLYKLDTNKKENLVNEGDEIGEKNTKVIVLKSLSVAPQRNKIELKQEANQVTAITDQPQQTSMKVGASQLSDRKTPSAVKQLFKMSRESLPDKIKETIIAHQKCQMSPKRIGALVQMEPRSMAQQLQDMTSCNLQAISLTKKHLISMTQVPDSIAEEGSHTKIKQNLKSPQRLNLNMPDNIKKLKLMSPSARSSAITQQRKSPYLNIKSEHGDIKSSQKDYLAKLKPTVQPQVLNPPQVAPVTQSRIINKDETMDTFLLDKMFLENAAQVQHEGLNQLEARIREQTANKNNVNAGTQAAENEPELSEEQSYRNSRMSHSNEPTLASKLSKKTSELEKLIQNQTSSDGSVDRSSQQNMTKLANRTHNLSIIDGSKLEQSDQRVTIVRHSQERDGFEMIDENCLNQDLPIKEVGGGSTTTRRLISKSSQHGSSMNANQAELKVKGLRNTLYTVEMQQKIDDASLAANTLSDVPQIQDEVKPLRIQIQSSINVGASYTFYNEAKHKIQGDELLVGSTSPEEEAEADPNPSPDFELKHIEEQNQAGKCTPALILAETPLQMIGLGAKNSKKNVKSMNSYSQANTSSQQPETPIQRQRVIKSVKGQHQIVRKHKPSSRFHETASFNGHVHKSTGLPIDVDRLESGLARENLVRQSYATQISFIGVPVQQHKTIDVLREESQDYQHSIHRRKARGCSGPQTSRTLKTLGEQIVHNTNNIASFLDAPVFMDKRVPKGTKLFVSNEAATAAAGVHKAAVSPMTRGGQQILALGTLRRNYDKTATPISKLLAPHEFTELQRFMGSGRNQNKMSQLSPGDYFRQKMPAREIVLNQVSTAKIITLPSMESASGLDLLSKIRAVDPQSGRRDSRTVNSSSPQLLNHNTQSQKWQHLKTSAKPVFGGAVKAIEDIDDKINLTYAPPNSLSTLEPTKALAPLITLATPQGNKRLRNNTKSPARRMQGKSIVDKSQSRYLAAPIMQQSPSMNNYRMIGLKAVLNPSDAFQAKEQTHVISANLDTSGMMTRSNSQADRLTIRVQSSCLTDRARFQQHQMGSDFVANQVQNAEPVEDNGQNEAESRQIGIIGVKFLSGLQQNDGTLSPQTQQTITFERVNGFQNPNQQQQQYQGHYPEQQYHNSPISPKQTFVSVEGQQIEIAEGVESIYKEQMARKQQLAKSARRRYASCSSRNKNDAQYQRHTVDQSESLKLSLQEGSGLPGRQYRNKKVAHSYIDNQRLKNSAQRDRYLFNDVKNWKQSVHRNNQLISGTSNQFATLN